MRLGVEIGGTFTDLVLVRDDGRIETAKVPSTRQSPAESAFRAINVVTTSLSEVRAVVHGSTIATNAVVERRGARVGFIVTEGFADILELQRQARTNVFDLKYVKPLPLVPRSLVAEIRERVRADGQVIAAPEPSQTIAAVEGLLRLGAESLAVCFLHAYRFPAHELRVLELVRKHWPDLPVTLSHEIAPIYREFERASTTILSAYVMPVVDRYLRLFSDGLAAGGFRGDLHIMQSNGGVLPVSLARRHAVRMLQSGPAGGVTAAKALVRQLKIRNAIAFDMGGTSTDVCLIQDGAADVTSESEIDHLPLRVPTLNIVSVGAGGGSIARRDVQGILRVGPESAGANPGPACYGYGGTAPTVTDANVVLGLVRPHAFLGGRMSLDREAAYRACAQLGGVLGTTALDAARAIVRVVNATMEGALRVVTTERGVDPRRFWLICYGGAGAQHAVALADALGLRGVIVPRMPGLFSAYGLLIADLRREWSASCVVPVTKQSRSALKRSVEDLREKAKRELADYQRGGRIRYELALAMRYPGQAFELDIAVSEDAFDRPDEIITRFHRAHRQRYGHAASEEIPELVNIRIAASVAQEKLRLPTLPRTRAPIPQSDSLKKGPRRVRFLNRATLRPGQLLGGPAVVEEETSTVWLPLGWILSVEGHGHLRIERVGQK